MIEIMKIVIRDLDPGSPRLRRASATDGDSTLSIFAVDSLFEPP